MTVPTFPLFHQSHQELRKSFNSKKSVQSIEFQPTTEQNEGAADLHTSRNKSSCETNGTLPVNPNDTKLQKSSSFMTALNDFKQQIILVFEPRYRHCVILGVGVPTVTQLSGIAILASYTTIIFENAGMDHAIIASALYGVSAIIGSFISVCLFDKLGRKTMAYISLSGMSISYLGLALSDLGRSSVSGPFSVMFAITCCFTFCMATGTLCVAYAPEVVPPEIAGVILGFGQSLSLLVSFTLVLAFPSVLDAVGALGAFLILFFFCACILLFLKVYMVETKGRELNDIVIELVKA